MKSNIPENIVLHQNIIINFIITRKNLIIETISALLILLFVYTALSKLLDFYSFRDSLKYVPLVGGINNIMAVAIPALELIIVVLIFLPKTKVLGLYAAFVLMSIFTFYVAYMLVFIPNNKLPCSCGGVLKSMSWKGHLLFNVFFTLLSLLAVRLKRKLGNLET